MVCSACQNHRKSSNCAFPDTRISQSARRGSKSGAPSLGEFFGRKSSRFFQKHELCGDPAGLSARHRYPTWWFFSNISTHPAWLQSVPFAMYTTTLAAPLGKGGKAAPRKRGRHLYSARFARSAEAAAGIYGGCGGLCSSAPFWASLALCQISDSDDPEKNFQKKLLLKTL